MSSWNLWVSYLPCFTVALLSDSLLFNAKWAIIQLYHGKKKLHFNEMMIMFAMYLTNTHSLIVIVILHWNNNLCTYSLMQKSSKDQFHSLWFDLTLNPRSTALEVSTFTITPPIWIYFLLFCNFIKSQKNVSHV